MAHGACMCIFICFDDDKRNDDDGQEMCVVVIHRSLSLFVVIKINAKPIFWKKKNHQTKCGAVRISVYDSISLLVYARVMSNNGFFFEGVFKFELEKIQHWKILVFVCIGMITGFRGHLLKLCRYDYY